MQHPRELCLDIVKGARGPALYALYQENLRLRELLTAVAQDLERLAAQEPAWRRLLRRAMRIRQRLHG